MLYIHRTPLTSSPTHLRVINSPQSNANKKYSVSFNYYVQCSIYYKKSQEVSMEVE